MTIATTISTAAIISHTYQFLNIELNKFDVVLSTFYFEEVSSYN
jgi:hypothetical protein